MCFQSGKCRIEDDDPVTGVDGGHLENNLHTSNTGMH